MKRLILILLTLSAPLLADDERERACQLVLARLSESAETFDVSHPAQLQVDANDDRHYSPPHRQIELKTGQVVTGASGFKNGGKVLGRAPLPFRGDTIYFLDGQGNLHLVNSFESEIRDLMGREYKTEDLPLIGDTRLRPPADKTLEDPKFQDQILDFVARPAGTVPPAKFSPKPSDADRLQHQAFEADQARARARHDLLPLLAHHPDKAKAKAAMMKILEEDPDPQLAAAVVALLWRTGQLTDADMDRALAVHFPAGSVDLRGHSADEAYWDGLDRLYHQAIVDWDRMNSAVVEQIPAAQLAHPNPDIQHRGIMMVRSMRRRKMPPAAQRRMELVLPQLKGHALDAARFALNLPAGVRGAVPDFSHVTQKPEDHPVFQKLLEDTAADRRQFGSNGNSGHEPWNQVRVNWPPAADKSGPFWIGQGPKEFDPYEMGHSMPDFDDYLRDRIGSAAVDLIRSDKVNVVVYGGSRETLRKTFVDFDPEKFIEVPSPYSEWGVHKYFVDMGDGGKPTLIFHIPPITDYAVHYQSLIHGAGKQPLVVLDEGDRQAYIRKWKTSSDSLAKNLEAKPDILILGYHDQWLEKLRHSPDWELLGIKGRHSDDGDLTGRVVTVRNRHNPNATQTFLLVKSERTLWGEATQHLTEGTLDAFPDLKEVWFMGSAGAPVDGNPAQSLTPYSVSYPRRFQTKDGKPIALKNSITVPVYEPGIPQLAEQAAQNAHPRFRAPKDELPVGLFVNGVHGYSASPALQTRGNIHWFDRPPPGNTIDVETSLVANAISARNAQRTAEGKPEIRFGAAHIVTDFPAGLNTKVVDNSLTSVTKETKRSARYHLVDTTLDFFGQRFYSDREIESMNFSISMHPPQRWIWPGTQRPIPLRYDERDDGFGRRGW